MKKLVIAVIAITVIIAGYSIYSDYTVKASMAKAVVNKTNEAKNTGPGIEQTNQEQSEGLTPSGLEQEIKTGKTLTVYFYSPQCIHCQRTTPVITPIVKKLDVSLEKFNLLEFQSGFAQFNIPGTPTIIVYKHGKELSRLVGEQDPATFNKWFKKYSLH